MTDCDVISMEASVGYVEDLTCQLRDAGEDPCYEAFVIFRLLLRLSGVGGHICYLSGRISTDIVSLKRAELFCGRGL
jgi:hypothetical protein